MKKNNYVSPDMKVFKIETRRAMLTASPVESSGGINDPVGSRGIYIYD